MSDITKNDSQISEVSLGDTINDWRTLTNDQIIAKLNLMRVYDIDGGTGLSVTGGFAGGGSGGTYEMEISDTIGKGITIGGDLVVTGNVSFSTAGEVSFPNGLVNVNGDDSPVAGYATGGIVVGSYTGPDFNTGTTAPFLLNLGGAWFTNQDLKMIGGGTLANASMQQILFGEANGKTLAFKQNVTDLIIGNGHTLDTIPVGSTLSGEIARIRSYDGRVDILRGVNKRRVSGVSHDFQFGNVVRASSADANGFTLAFGGGGSTLAEAVGMISRDNGDSDFEVTFNGEVEGDFTTVSGGVLSVGCPYFLSPLNPGFVTTVEPNTPGHVSKPVLIGLSADRGLFVNYRGQEVNSFAGGGGGGGATGNGRSIRIPKPSGFAVGDLVGINDSGTYIKLTTANNALQHISRTLGLVVNDSEMLLHGVTEPTDTFDLATNIRVFDSDGDPLYYGGYQTGQLSQRPEVFPSTPLAMRLGASNQIYFFNTRPGQGYSNPSQGALDNVLQDPDAFTAEEVKGGINGAQVGGGGLAGSNTVGQGIKNLLVNGGFDIWQRGVGVDSIYTGNEKTYFADRWYRNKRVTAPVGKDIAEIERVKFPEGQTDVGGNPEYYARVRANFAPGAGETAVDGGDFISWNNVIEDANTLAGQPAVVSFYAMGATGVTGFLAVEYTQYWEGTTGGTSSNQILPLVYLDGEYKWTRYSMKFAPVIGPTASGLINRDESWAQLSIFPYRFQGVTGNTGAADVLYAGEVSLAKVQMEPGFIVTDPSIVDIDQELRRCKRFYQTSYKVTDYVGKSTMLSTSSPDESTPSISMISGSSRSLVRIPVELRKVPTSVKIYSPKGTSNMAFNLSAGRELDKTSGTRGYNNQARSWESRASVFGTSSSTTGFGFNSLFGWVFGDVVAFHYVLNSEFNTGVNE